MSHVQRIALGMLFLTGAATVGYLVTSPRVFAPIAGTMAADDSLGSPQILATVEADRLAAGPIVAIGLQDESVYLLQNHHWLRVEADSVHGPYGGETRGGIGWIFSAAAIAATDSAVFILDRLAKSVHVFDPDGEWRRSIPLRSSIDHYDFAPERMTIGPDGTIIISGFEPGDSAGWTIATLSGDTLRPLFRQLSTIFDIVLPLVRHDRSIIAVNSMNYEFTALSPNGDVEARLARRNAPRVPLTQEQSDAMANYIRGSQTGTRPEFTLPTHMPAVADAFARSGGTFLGAVLITMDDVLIEEIDHRGKPIRTLVREVPLPVGLSDTSIVLLREEPQHTIVERYRIPGSRP